MLRTAKLQLFVVILTQRHVFCGMLYHFVRIGAFYVIAFSSPYIYFVMCRSMNIWSFVVNYKNNA